MPDTMPLSSRELAPDHLAGILDPQVLGAALERAGHPGSDAVRIARVHFSSRRPTVLQLSLPRSGGSDVLLAELIGDDAESYAATEVRRLSKPRRSQLSRASKSPILADPKTGLVFRPIGLDARLPGLRLLYDALAVDGFLKRHLGPQARAARQVGLMAHRLGKRAVVRITMANGQVVFVRLGPTANDGPERAYKHHVGIAAALEGRGDVSVPRPLGFDHGLGAAVYGALPGRPPRQIGDEGLCDAHASIRALDTLHLLPHAHLPWHGTAEELAILVDWVARVSILRPEYGDLLVCAMARVADDLGATSKLPGGFCHRDFHEGQILINGKHAGVLDFDTAASADPMLDVGNLMAHYFLAGLRAGSNSVPFELSALSGPDSKRSACESRRALTWRRAALLRLACIYAVTSEPEKVVRPLFTEAAT